MHLSDVSVTNEAPVPPPPHHQREPSPEYWLIRIRTPIPISPHTWDWLHTHLLIITLSPYKHTTHIHPCEVLVCLGDHFWALFHCGLFILLWPGLFLVSGFSAACPDPYLFTGLWFYAACPDPYLFIGLWFSAACPILACTVHALISPLRLFVFIVLVLNKLHMDPQSADSSLQKTSTSFLGYIISQEGVAMDENKVRAVLEWPQPHTVKELQRFLGFANFYRWFIRNFSAVAAPLTAMTKRSTSWNPEALLAFQELKTRFTSAPILHPDPRTPFIVEVDASSTGIGAVLSQRQGTPAKMFPCAFYSRKLSSAERNYDVGNRELLAMKAALEEWRHWLEGAQHPFTVLTDHKNLEYLCSAKRLNPRQARWAMFFTRFNFSHVPTRHQEYQGRCSIQTDRSN